MKIYCSICDKVIRRGKFCKSCSKDAKQDFEIKWLPTYKGQKKDESCVDDNKPDIVCDLLLANWVSDGDGTHNIV